MPTERTQRDLAARLHAALESRDPGMLTTLLEDLHAADLAEIFPDLMEEDQLIVLQALDDEQAAMLLGELEPDEQTRVFDLITVDRASDILEEMSSDDAADLLAELPTEEADALLERMEPEEAEDVAELLRYSEDTAGGLMAKEFVRLSPDETVAEVMQGLRRHQDDAEMIYYLYVLDEDDRLLGMLTLRTLIVSDPSAVIADIMDRELISVETATPQEEVAETVRRHDLLAVPVLDHEGRMQGIVTVDDVGDVVREEAAEDLLEVGGAEEHEEEDRWSAFRRGWRSGILALIGGSLAVGVVWFFSRTLLDWRHVAPLLPLLLLLTITLGSQAALAMDHAFASTVERHQASRIFFRELLAGAALAAIGAILAGIITLLLRHQVRIALAVAIPMAGALWTSAIVGALGAAIIRRSGGRLGPASHTSVVAVGVLLAVTTFFLIAEWSAVLVLRPQP